MKLAADCHAITNGLLKTFCMRVYSNYELWSIYKMNLYAHLMHLAMVNRDSLLWVNELYYLAEEFPVAFAKAVFAHLFHFMYLLRPI